MDDTVMKEAEVFFKKGATVVPDGTAAVYDIVRVQANEVDGKPTMRGWADGQKPMYFLLDGVEKRPDGWIAHDTEGVRVLLKPITDARSEALLSRLDD